MRWVHYVAMIIVIVNLVWRLWYAFASKRRDYREFAITKRDITTAPKVILYYIFVKPSKPHLGKYNVMQKSTYIIFVPLLIVQAITGFALLTYPIPFTQAITFFGHAGVTGRDVIVGWWAGSAAGLNGPRGLVRAHDPLHDQLAVHRAHDDSRVSFGHRGLSCVPRLLWLEFRCEEGRRAPPRRTWLR